MSIKRPKREKEANMTVGNLQSYQDALCSFDLERIKEAGEYLRKLENLCIDRKDETTLAGLSRRRRELLAAYLSMQGELESVVDGQEAKAFVAREIDRLNRLLKGGPKDL